jgi:Asp-tRNA(Asn)/Glu-tRNA(Gln) amidotransferase C subunit
MEEIVDYFIDSTEDIREEIEAMNVKQLEEILNWIGTSEKFSLLSNDLQTSIQPDNIRNARKDDLVEFCLDVFGTLTEGKEEAMGDVKTEK